MSPRRRARLLAMVFALAALSLVIPFVVGEMRLAANLDFYDDNSWVLYGLFRIYDPALFPHDYAADYYRSLWMPPGFMLLQYLWAQCCDPLILHRILPLVLWFGCAPFVFVTAKRLGGSANALVTLAIYLSSSVFMHRMAASLPHSFAPFFMWWTVAALVSGRPVSLAICTIVSATFYPIVTPIAGLTLAIGLLFPRLTPLVPQRSAVWQWSWKGKCAFLMCAGILTLLAMTPMILAHFSTAYGRALDVIADSAAFPELAHSPAPPALTLLLLIYYIVHSVRLGWVGGFMLTAIGFLVLLIGQALRDIRDRRPSGLAPFIIASVAICLAANVLDYDNVYRYVVYTVPIWITLFLPLAMRRISRRWFAKENKAPAFMIMALAYMSCTALADPEASGYPYRLEEFQKHAVAFVRTLPEDTLIAGWPGNDSGRVVEVLPYMARRQVLVTWETHANIHKDYVLAMRTRMNAIVDAYLAHDIAPLINLRDRFHVDYLVVNEADFTSGKPPKYFQPFDDRARALWEEGKGTPFIVLQLAKKANVYSKDGIDMIDLRKL